MQSRDSALRNDTVNSRAASVSWPAEAMPDYMTEWKKERSVLW